MQDFINYLFSDNQPEWWPDLYEQYVERRANDDTRFVLGLMKEIMYLQNQYFICSNIITNLQQIVSICKSDEVFAEIMAETTLISEIKSHGVNRAFNTNNREQFVADLLASKTFIKRFKSQIKIREKELEDYKKANDGKEITREYFESVVVEYSKFMGDMIDFEKITVARWCSIAEKYDAYCEVMNAENEKAKVKVHGYGNN